MIQNLQILLIVLLFLVMIAWAIMSLIEWKKQK